MKVAKLYSHFSNVVLCAKLYNIMLRRLTSVTLIFLSILLANMSLYAFIHSSYAFKPSNQLTEQQSQPPIVPNTAPPLAEISSNVNITRYPLALPDLQKRMANRTVEIVFGAALLGDKAYDPNPLIVGLNTTVMWHNKDDILHTVTSGLGMEDNSKGKEFDSQIISSDKTYFHTFSRLGEFPYFCFLHPTMVGKVIVIRNETQ